MPICKVFVVGPEKGAADRPGYQYLREAIERLFAQHIASDAGGFDRLEIYDPRHNPGGDNFNDWIFGQIDTCSILIADTTGFNPNVVYEIAMAHALGVPCQYIRFGRFEEDDFIFEGEDSPAQMAHYFAYALLFEASSSNPKVLLEGGFADRLLDFFKTGKSPSGNLLTQYYGGVPLVDSEFTRGLARTYFRNFLFPLLRLGRDEECPAEQLIIVLPDTLTKPDSLARDCLLNSLPNLRWAQLGGNILKRPFDIMYLDETATAYDLPSISFTIRDCPRFKKVDKSHLFSDRDLDRITDAMTRKFVDQIKHMLNDHFDQLETLSANVKFRWLSEIAGDWADDVELMNRDPLD